MDDLRPGADAIDRAHDLEVDVLLAVSSHAVAGQSLMDFYSRLARTMGELVSAEKVLFWRLGDDNMLAGIQDLDEYPVRTLLEGRDGSVNHRQILPQVSRRFGQVLAWSETPGDRHQSSGNDQSNVGAAGLCLVNPDVDEPFA